MTSSVLLFRNFNNNHEKYADLSDNELIDRIRNGEDEAEKYFYLRYSYIVRKIVGSFFVFGADKDDLFQEAMIGLMKAVKCYNYDISANFRNFALLCMKRQIISTIRKSRGYGRNQLNNSISIYELDDSDYGMRVAEKLESHYNTNPEIVYVDRESMNDFMKFVWENLSEFEKMVFMEYGKGYSYEEISVILKKDVKSIDNALQRIRKKAGKNRGKIL